MSLVDLNSMSPLALLSQYVTETCGSTHFLTRDEVNVLEGWLRQSSGQCEEVILILEEVLPRKLEALRDQTGKRVSMKSLNKLVVGRLEQRRALKG